MPDHGGEDAERDVADPAYPDARLHQIEKHVDARAHFRDAVIGPRRQRRRRGADADHRTGQAGIPQRLGRDGHPCALLLGRGGQRGSVLQIVALARMAHDSSQQPVRGQDPADADETIAVVPPHAGAVIVDIDFDQGRDDVAGLPAVVRRGQRHLLRVQNDLQVDAAFAHLGNARQLLRADADRIEKVGHSALPENFRLLQRRDSGGTGWRAEDEMRRFHGFGGFQMGTKTCAQSGDPLAHAPGVVFQLAAIEQQARRGKGFEIEICDIHERTPAGEANCHPGRNKVYFAPSPG